MSLIRNIRLLIIIFCWTHTISSAKRT